jgi:nucleoside-diphosphate-sugar epimerase
MHDADNLKMVTRLVKSYPQAKIIYAQSGSIMDIASPYAFSKWACGEYLGIFHKNTVSCVFPNVFGGGKGVVDIFKGKDHVTIYGDGMQIRDFVHVDDIVRGLVMAKDWKHGQYFMGSGQGRTILSIAKGKNVHFANARAEQRESVLPNTTPNWKPEIDVMEYINA